MLQKECGVVSEAGVAEALHHVLLEGEALESGRHCWNVALQPVAVSNQVVQSIHSGQATRDAPLQLPIAHEHVKPAQQLEPRAPIAQREEIERQVEGLPTSFLMPTKA